MKLKIQSRLFKKALIFNRGIYPVHISGENSYVVMEAYDGIKYVRASFNADVEGKCEVVIPAKYLPMFERFDGEFTIETGQETVKCQDESRHFNIPHIPLAGSLFPSTFIEVGSITMELEDLQQLVRRVVFASGNDSQKGYDRILLSFGDVLRVVGCDRRVVAVAQKECGSPYRGELLLAEAGMEVILKLSGNMATLTICEGGVLISSSGDVMYDIYIPKYTGKFPMWEELIKVSAKTTVSCGQEELLSILKDMRTVSEKTVITCAMNGGYVRKPLRFKSSDENSASVVRIPSNASWEGEELKVAVNASSLLRALQNLEGEIIFHFINDETPFLVTARQEFLAVMMPYSPGEKK